MKEYLSKNPLFFTIFSSLAAFCTYLCFYPFRRAYTAALYEGVVFWGINYKILIITAQVLGFAVSKGLGIKFVSEMTPEKRAKNLLLMNVISLVCMLFFALTPMPYNLLFIFLGSLPLGMFYGTILGFLEGRKVSDLLVAVLTASFIIGSGFAKSIGNFIMQHWHISETWMPFVADVLMMPPLLLSIGALTQIPPPTAADIASRTERKPMPQAVRKAFIQDFLWGIVLFVCSYILLTAFREFRDNFAPEIWKAMGYANNSSIFTQTEVPIAIAVLLIMAAMRWVQNNYKAFFIIEGLILVGGLLIGLSTFLYQQHLISPMVWFTLLGFGVYLAYSMCNSLYFERMIASFRREGTVGFLITFADYYAYLGSILVLFYKNFFQIKISYLDFFIVLSYCLSIAYVILIALSIVYFHQKKKN